MSINDAFTGGLWGPREPLQPWSLGGGSLPLLSLDETRQAQRAAAKAQLAAAQACPSVGVAVAPAFPDPCQATEVPPHSAIPRQGLGSDTRHLLKPPIIIAVCSLHPSPSADVATAVDVWAPTAKKERLSPVYAHISTKTLSRHEASFFPPKCRSHTAHVPFSCSLPPSWRQ